MSSTIKSFIMYKSLYCSTIVQKVVKIHFKIPFESNSRVIQFVITCLNTNRNIRYILKFYQSRCVIEM